jgi:hypothetical protein
MDYVTAEQFLLNQIPLRHRVLFAPVFENAYAAAEALAKAEPVLQEPSAEDNLAASSHGLLTSASGG